MLISMPTGTSTIFGAFQVIEFPPRLDISSFEIWLRETLSCPFYPCDCDAIGSLAVRQIPKRKYVCGEPPSVGLGN